MSNEWNCELLSDVCAEITSGGTAPQGEVYFKDGISPFVRVADMGRNQGKKYISRTKDLLNNKGTERLRLFPAGTVLFTKSGASLLLNQRAILKEPMYVVSHIGCMIPGERVIPEWLYYWMNTVDFNQYAHATTLPSIKLTTIKNLKIPIPSIEEQNRIVSRIEEMFSQLDAGFETLMTTKEQLDVYRQAVLKDAFEGMFPNRPLSEIAKALSGYAFKSKKYDPEGEYIVVKIGNVKQKGFDFSRDLTRTNEVSEEILKKYLLKQGDCLITMTGSRGKRDYGFVTLLKDETNYLLNQRVAALRFNQSIAIPEFYQYYLSSPDYRNEFFSYETGNVGQGNVGIKALIEPSVICPTIEEQKRIVETIASRLSVCNSIERTVEETLQHANAMRQSILKDAFEGKL